MKRVAIVQSNYIPWKGYFDLIAAVDEFVLYDDVQYTIRDWRNRNQIKTPEGVKWLTVPVGADRNRRIRDVELRDSHWQAKHWKTLVANYRRAPHFDDVETLLAPLYLQRTHASLSAMNRSFIEAICGYLGIATRIADSSLYQLADDRSERLAAICAQAGANEYLSGPAAREYLDEAAFERRAIRVRWADYSGYPEYPQLWGTFVHGVSIVDLLFNCGRDARRYMKAPA
jgi:hypothetical protein